MTILLYDYFELEERPSKHLKAWKAWHLVLYVCAAVFGLANYILLYKAKELVDGHCLLYPRKLEFHVVQLEAPNSLDINEIHEFKNITEDAQTTEASDKSKDKRETDDNEPIISDEFLSTSGNVTGNRTHHLALDTARSLFQSDSDCQFADYMPVLSTVFAGVWLTMFTMCPGGGHARSGLHQPWRILAPALLFALVMVGVTGHSFTLTNGGLHAFCAAFYDYTNSTTCSSVEPLLELGWNSSWGFGSRSTTARASSAAVWASWACAAALLLARCLTAPDFVVKRTDVYLTKDPQQKIVPHLLKSPKYVQKSDRSSPTKQDNMSLRSEPTVTTELVTASVEHGQDSAPTSLMASPINSPRNVENIEMTYTPQETSENRFKNL